MSVNRVILVGRLGSEPKLTTTKGGKNIANFSVATDESFKDKSGTKQKRTEWHRLTAFDKQADIIGQYLTTGSLVYVEGKIQSHEYVDKNQQKRTSYDIIVNNFRMLGGNETEVEPETPFVPTNEDIPF